ncbi:MAG TPA: copper-translocating P-type ATPase [Patescibacteria group bacterium]
MQHEHKHHNHQAPLAKETKCELCGMIAEHMVKDQHGVTHHYCSHHLPQASHSAHAEHDGHSEHDKHAGHNPDMFRDRFWLSLALTIPVIFYSHMIQMWLGFTAPTFPGSQWLSFVLGTIIFFYGGTVFVKSALAEIKAKLPGMMTLISLAIIAAYGYSVATTFFIKGSEFFWELATLITIMLLGHWIEMKSVASAQGALKELAKLLPDEAELVQGRETKKVAIAELKASDIVLVRPGAKIPADGEIVEGESTVNEAMITGESKPILKTVGSAVIAGTINESGSLKVKVTKIGENTALAGIMRLVAEAQASHSKAQILADKAAFYLTFIALIAGVGALVGWLTAGAGVNFALESMVGVLIIACPHALGLAVPLVTAISTSKAAQNGLLVRQRVALEAARNIDVVLFDKTGTLTKGEQGLSDVYSAGKVAPDEILSLIASVEAPSEHSIGRALVAAAKEKKVKLTDVTGFSALKGKGVTAKVGNDTYFVGGPRMLAEQKAALPTSLEAKIKAADEAGKTIIYLIKEKNIFGAVTIADTVRPESKEAIQSLHNLGVRVAMLTGDSQGVAKWVAKELGVTEYFAEVLPEHKVDKVKELQKDGSKVAMVGDGVNDAPALTQANVGIAIGAGTDVAIESAGIILVKSDPRDVVKIIRLSKATYKKMVQNLVWATGYNVIAIPLAAGILAPWGLILPPALGAGLMSISTVVVALNAQLLRRLQLDNV